MKKFVVIMVAALMTGSNHTMAQSYFGLEYYGELQSDFKGGFNFPNLLRLNLDMPAGRFVTIEASSISIAKTSKERLVDDLQTFSNIEEDNLPFALARLGLAVQLVEGHTLYLGIRNVNEDYFTSPVTSLFTNSSCGIFPTISCNYPIANYPLASICLHYAFESDHWQALASLYNGIGYNKLWGRENVFRFCPGSDGLFVICQGAYKYNGSYYGLGACMHTLGPSGTLWAYAEQRITDGFSLIADYSHTFGQTAPCTDFLGLGGRYMFRKAALGLFTDYAHFRDNYEWATELTCLFQITEHISIQPALHMILQKDLKAVVGLFRLSISL